MSRIHFSIAEATLYEGDCLEVLAGLPDSSVDAVVTDPPYGLANTTPRQVAETLVRWINGERDYLPGGTGFMGKAWDAFVPPVAVWDECLRVLKPGGHALVFAGTRTVDLMGLALRLAGFDIRDSLTWMYAAGFPKSLDIGKAIDRAAGAEREVVGDKLDRPGYYLNGHDSGTGAFGKGLSSSTPSSRLAAALVTTPATDAAQQWDGFGTALKPSHEPILLARKPLEGTVAQNVLRWGTGGLNIDGCRVGSGGQLRWERPRDMGYRGGSDAGQVRALHSDEGRWPPNLLLTHSADCAETCALDCPVRMLDDQSGETADGVSVGRNRGPERKETSARAAPKRVQQIDVTYGGYGGASRFFPQSRTDSFCYTAKAPSRERPRGRDDGIAHPTVKPLEVMRWLVRLVTPPGGLVLDPFAGSGTTGEAALLEGARALLIEREPAYLNLVVQRLTRQRDPVAHAEATGTEGEGLW
jgi:site-specific DNA-methyltransferase (adenine-specific)